MPLEKELWSRQRAADLRDEMATARENALAIRERHVAIREQQNAGVNLANNISGSFVDSLRKANENLIISGMRAQATVEELEDEMGEMWQMAHHDQLTGLPNRLLLSERLAAAIPAAEHVGAQLAVLFADLDKFKPVNDTFGHAVGDQLLQAVALRLLAATRKTDTVSRQGGDEFVLLLKETSSKSATAAIAEKVCQSVAKPYLIDGNIITIGITVGISIFPLDCDSPVGLLKNADAAMYKAKIAGGSAFRFFASEAA